VGKTGEGWNTVFLRTDLNLQINTIYHTEMVINLGRQWYLIMWLKKPCAFINYDVTKSASKVLQKFIICSFSHHAK
jgi:hypothetical protein